MLIFLLLFGGPVLMMVFKLLGIQVDRSCLGCGMVGFCGDSPADPNIIRMLLMYNNTRGGDATGWVVNNQITKESDPVDKFLEKSKLIVSPDHENYTVIAHARKASSGMRYNKAHAHPFGIYKGGVEKEKYDLVLAMNGSLSSEEEFAKHFKFDWNKNMNSDTEMLAKVMCELGPVEYVDALIKYDGVATLLFFTPKSPNTLMVFKDPGRTLFCYQETPTRIYVSSMKESFKAIGADDDKVLSFKDNHVYFINKGKVEKMFEVHRDPLKKVAHYQDEYESAYGYNRHTSSRKTGNTYSHTPSPPRTPSYYELDISKMDRGGDKLYLHYDKYFRNHHPLTGEFYVAEDGSVCISENSKDYRKDMKKKFFMVGYMMKDQAAYEELKSRVWQEGDINWVLFGGIPTSHFLKYVDYPIMIIGDKQQLWVLPEEMQKKHYKQVGDVFTYRHFLGFYEISFKANKYLVEESDIRCWEVVNYKRIEEPKETPKPIVTEMKRVLDGWNIYDLKAFTRKTIANNPDISPKNLFNAARLSYFRMCGSAELREYYYEKVLIPMATDFVEGFWEARSHVLINNGKQRGWESKEIEKELQDIIVGIHKKLLLLDNGTMHEQDNAQDIDHEEIVGNKTDVTKLKPSKRIQLATLNHSAESISEVVESLKSSNEFMGNVAFNKEMLNPTTGDYMIFASKFVKNEDVVNEQTANFARAVLYKLHDFKVLKIKELADILEYDDSQTCYEASKKYEQWVKDCEVVEFNVTTEGELTEVKKPAVLVDAETEIGYEVTEGEYEKYSEIDAEAEIEDAVTNLLENADHLLSYIDEAPEELKTERIKQIESKTREWLTAYKEDLYNKDKFQTHD